MSLTDLPIIIAEQAPEVAAAPIVDPAPADPTPPADPPSDPPPAPAFDETAYLTEATGGLVKSRDELAGIIERSKAADEVEGLREQLRTAYPNEFTRSIAQMVAKGADVNQLKTFIDLSLTEDISKMDDYEALVKAAYLKESDVLTAEDAKMLIESKYPKSAEELAVEKGLSDEEAEKQFRILDIERKREVKQAREFLSGFKKSVYENVVTNQSQKTEVLEKSWQPVVPAIETQLSTESVKLDISDEKAGINTSFEVKLPQDFVERFVKSIPKWMASSGVEVNSENISHVINEAKKVYVANNYPQIIESAIRDTWAKVVKLKEEEFSNPIKPGQPSGQAQPANAGGWVDNFYR